jgi:hypothetical protein
LFVSSIEPFRVEEALHDPDWVLAMQEELNNFKRNEVWSMVPRLKQNVVGTKWVFRNVTLGFKEQAGCISYMRQEDNIYNNRVYRDKCHNNLRVFIT